MPDISKCPGNTCEVKNKCWRYTCLPTPHWQSYFVDVPVVSGKQCEVFWDDSEYSDERKIPIDQRTEAKDGV